MKKKFKRKKKFSNPSNYLRYLIFSRCPSNLSLVLKPDLKAWSSCWSPGGVWCAVTEVMLERTAPYNQIQY